MAVVDGALLAIGRRTPPSEAARLDRYVLIRISPVPQLSFVITAPAGNGAVVQNRTCVVAPCGYRNCRPADP